MLVTRLLRWGFDSLINTATNVVLPATSITGLDGMSSTRVARGIAPHAGAGRRSRDLVARLVRWSFSPATNAVSITSATVTLPTTTIAEHRYGWVARAPDRAHRECGDTARRSPRPRRPSRT